MLCTVGNCSIFALFIIYFVQYYSHTNVISVLLLFWSSLLFVLIVFDTQFVTFHTFPVLDCFQSPFRILQIPFSNTNVSHCAGFFAVYVRRVAFQVIKIPTCWENQWIDAFLENIAVVVPLNWNTTADFFSCKYFTIKQKIGICDQCEHA